MFELGVICESTVPLNVIVSDIALPKSTLPFATKLPDSVVVPVTPKLPPIVVSPVILASSPTDKSSVVVSCSA